MQTWYELEYKSCIAGRLFRHADGKKEYLGSLRTEVLATCFHEGRFLLGLQLGGQIHHPKISDEDLSRLRSQMRQHDHPDRLLGSEEPLQDVARPS